jgi:uncharacterized protein YndB with AHSA1/START domain
MENTNELLVTKVFNATPERVWKAWTTPGEIAQWFAPGLVMEVRELDVRPSGQFRFADPSDKDSGEYTGIYTTVEPFQKLSFNVVDFSQSSDSEGVKAGYKVEFEKIGEQTKMSLTSVPPENSNDKTTFDAWSACFDRMEKVIELTNENRKDE